MKLLGLAISLLVSSPQQSSLPHAWFYAADNQAKVLYITDVQRVDLENRKWEDVNFEEGFKVQRNWTKRPMTQLFVDFRFISTIPRHRTQDLARRERIVKAHAAKGYSVQKIAMPRPAPLKITPGRGSRQ